MRMKTAFYFLIAFLSVFPGALEAQHVSGRFSTSVYGLEKYDTVNVSSTVARGIQTLQLNIAQGNVSLQTYLSGAISVDESFGNSGEIRARNLFLQWRDFTKGFDINLGRIPVFAGVGIGAVDGALLRAKMMNDELSCVAYGGANVRPDSRSSGTDNLSQNFFVGGQVISTMVPSMRIGVSYMNRNIERDSYIALRPDSFYNAVAVLIQPDSRAQQKVGLDARYSESDNFYAYGRYDYDLNLKRSLRGELKSRLAVTTDLAFTGDFIYREPQIDYNSIFTIFPVSSIRELEGGIEYALSKDIRGYGRVGYVKYTDDQSRRLSIGVNSEYAAFSYSGTNGYAGLLSSYDLQGMYPLFDRKFVPTVGVSFARVRYDTYAPDGQNIYGGIFGFAYRPIQTFSFNTQMQWLRTPIAKNDVRFLGTINYWFDHNLNLFAGKEESK
jgi:hypothetical protein